VTVSARAGNTEVPDTLANASRPLCPAPQVARYTGGDTDAADSFTCE